MARHSEEHRRSSLPARRRIGRPPRTETRPFTSSDVRIERFILAEDMLALILREGEQMLPAQTQETLRRLYEALGAIRRQVRHVP